MLYHSQVQTKIKNSYLSSAKMKRKEVPDIFSFLPFYI